MQMTSISLNRAGLLLSLRRVSCVPAREAKIKDPYASKHRLRVHVRRAQASEEVKV